MAGKSGLMTNVAMLASIILIVMASRLIPHPPNFSALLAAALFAGAKASNRWLGYLVPVVALWLSDLIIGVHYLMPLIAACVVLTTWIGQRGETLLAGKGKWTALFGWASAGLIASIIFFAVTNFAVWDTSGMYPRTQAGLWECFIAAIPFFHNQVLGTWVFSGALFGGYQLAVREVRSGSTAR